MLTELSALTCAVIQVAIISQEESAMYVTYFDFDKLEFMPEMGESVYVFPRTHHCEVRGLDLTASAAYRGLGSV